jgi:transposase-like protein
MGIVRPSSMRSLLLAYADEDACRSALVALRWPDGFRCPTCGSEKASVVAARSLIACGGCGRQISATTDTDLHRHHLPLTTWFAAAWLVGAAPGVNTTRLMRELSVGRRTAHEILARLRPAMSRSLTAPLSGMVEADKAFLGRKEHQSTVEVLAEARSEGRVRMGVVAGQTMAVLTPFIAERVEAGATIRTDGWKGYNGLDRAGFTHERIVHAPGWVERGERSTPHADEAISAVKRWLLAVYNKPPTPANLDAYLAEFCFRREFRDPGTAFEALLRGLVTPR